MFKSIILFELKQQSIKKINYILFILFILQGVFYVKHTSDFFSTDTSFHNSPAVIYVVLAGMGYLTFILAALFAAKALGRDLDQKTTAIFYTTSVKENHFFWGRYLASFLVLLFLSTGYFIGIMLYPYTSISPQNKLMPFDLYNLLKAILIIFIPNIFIIYTTCFSLATLFKKNAGAYISTLFFFVFMIFGDTAKEYGDIYTIVDATGFANLHLQLENLLPNIKNSYSLPIKGYFLINRILWLSLAILLLFFSYKSFSFVKFNTKKYSFLSIVKQNTVQQNIIKPVIKINTSLTSRFLLVLKIATFEFKNITRSLAFKFFMLFIFIMFITYVTIYHQTYYSETITLPIALEITQVAKPLAFFIFLFLIVSTTELLFKEKSANFWLISDATPIPNWSVLISKILAMFFVSILLCVGFIFMGISIQIFKGFYNFQLEVYFEEFIIRWLPKYLQYILMTTFIASITAKKQNTYILTCMLLMFTSVAHETNMIQEFKYLFTFSPGGDYNTDMNGYGIFTQANTYFVVYWSSFVLFLFFIALLIWQRGIPVSLLQRIKNSKKRLNFLIGSLLFITGIIFIIYAYRINNIINYDNKFISIENERIEKALYEKKYSVFKNSSQPKIRTINANIDLYTRQRKMIISAKLMLKNTSNKLIDTLHLEWANFYKINKIKLTNHTLKIIDYDKRLKHARYLISPAIPKDKKVQLVINAELKYFGFTNNDPQKSLVLNGSYLQDEILPKFIGFDDNKIISQNQYREIMGLKKLHNRLPKTSKDIYVSKIADTLSYRFTISTTKGQSIVVPGILQNKWNKNNRNYFEYKFNNTWYKFAILSAKYNQKTIEQIIGKNTVTIQTYASPKHLYNLDIIEEAAQKALSNLNTVFGQYPYKTLKIVERPRYDNSLDVFDNVIVLPENHAWIANTNSIEGKEYIYYTLTRLIAKQYMNKLHIKRVQGYPVFTKSIPEYLALHFIKKDFGHTILIKHLKNLDDHYKKGVSGASNKEIEWRYSDDCADYISESKGGLEVYKIANKKGHSNFIKYIRTFYIDNKNRVINPIDFIF